MDNPEPNPYRPTNQELSTNGLDPVSRRRGAFAHIVAATAFIVSGILIYGGQFPLGALFRPSGEVFLFLASVVVYVLLLIRSGSESKLVRSLERITIGGVAFSMVYVVILNIILYAYLGTEDRDATVIGALVATISLVPFWVFSAIALLYLPQSLRMEGGEGRLPGILIHLPLIFLVLLYVTLGVFISRNKEFMSFIALPNFLSSNVLVIPILWLCFCFAFSMRPGSGDGLRAGGTLLGIAAVPLAILEWTAMLGSLGSEKKDGLAQAEIFPAILLLASILAMTSYVLASRLPRKKDGPDSGFGP